MPCTLSRMCCCAGTRRWDCSTKNETGQNVLISFTVHEEPRRQIEDRPIPFNCLLLLIPAWHASRIANRTIQFTHTSTRPHRTRQGSVTCTTLRYVRAQGEKPSFPSRENNHIVICYSVRRETFRFPEREDPYWIRTHVKATTSRECEECQGWHCKSQTCSLEFLLEGQRLVGTPECVTTLQ